jgi:hypothetical protein
MGSSATSCAGVSPRVWVRVRVWHVWQPGAERAALTGCGGGTLGAAGGWADLLPMQQRVLGVNLTPVCAAAPLYPTAVSYRVVERLTYRVRTPQRQHGAGQGLQDGQAGHDADHPIAGAC